MPMGCALGNMRCLVAVMLACAVAVAPARAQPSPASPVSSIRVTGDGTVTDSATQAGANHVQGIQFTLRDQDAVRAEALRQAATRARAEADVLAAALGLKVVRVLSVEENSPRVVPVRAYMGAARALAT